MPSGGLPGRAGKRRSRRLGSSLEFADYRVYAPGDDVRRFDWGVYSRTGKAFVRQFMDEQELTVSLFVDCSASMGAVMSSSSELSAQIRQERRKVRNGRTSTRRKHRLHGIVLLRQAQIACYSRSINARLPIMRGKGSAHRLFSFLQGAETGGEGSLGARGSWRTPGDRG